MMSDFVAIPGASNAASAAAKLSAAIRAAVPAGVGRTVLEVLASKSVEHLEGGVCSVSKRRMSSLGGQVRKAVRRAMGYNYNYKLSDVVSQLSDWVECSGSSPAHQYVRLRVSSLLAAQQPSPATAAASSSGIGSTGSSAGSSAGSSDGCEFLEAYEGVPVILPSGLARLTARPELWGPIPLGPLAFDVDSPTLRTPDTVRSALEDAIHQQSFPGLSRAHAALARAVMAAVLGSSTLRALPMARQAQQAQQGPLQLELEACFRTDAERGLENMLRAAQYQDACQEYYNHWMDMVYFYRKHSELHGLVEYEKVPGGVYTFMGKFLLRADRLLGMTCTRRSGAESGAGSAAAPGASNNLKLGHAATQVVETREHLHSLGGLSVESRAGRSGSSGRDAGGGSGSNPGPKQEQLWLPKQQQHSTAAQPHGSSTSVTAGSQQQQTQQLQKAARPVQQQTQERQQQQEEQGQGMGAGSTSALQLLGRLQAARQDGAARAAGLDAQLVGTFMAALTWRPGAGEAGMVLAALLESADWGAACSFMRAAIKLAGA